MDIHDRITTAQYRMVAKWNSKLSEKEMLTPDQIDQKVEETINGWTNVELLREIAEAIADAEREK